MSEELKRPDLYSDKYHHTNDNFDIDLYLKDNNNFIDQIESKIKEAEEKITKLKKESFDKGFKSLELEEIIQAVKDSLPSDKQIKLGIFFKDFDTSKVSDRHKVKGVLVMRDMIQEVLNQKP